MEYVKDPEVALQRFAESSRNSEHICYAVVGASNSGKTTFVKNLIYAMGDCIDVLLLCSRTEGAQNNFTDLSAIHVKDIKDLFDNLLQVNEAGLRVLLVLDDMEERLYKTDTFSQLLRQTRHYHISVITITHDIQLFSPNVRKEMDFFYIFRTGELPSGQKICTDLTNHFQPNERFVCFGENWHRVMDPNYRTHCIYIPKNPLQMGKQLFPTLKTITQKRALPISTLTRYIIQEYVDNDAIGEQKGRKRHQPSGKDADAIKKKRPNSGAGHKAREVCVPLESE